MRTTITDLNGEQQNCLLHLSKGLKRAVSPLMIICYGHRSFFAYQNSAFSETKLVKKTSSVFDFFLLVDDGDILPDSTLMEIARRNTSAERTGNILIFRQEEVLANLRQGSRFFANILRKGILLHGDNNLLQQLPHPLPPVCFTSSEEKLKMQYLLKQAQGCLNKMDKKSFDGQYDTYMDILLLNEAAVNAIKYFFLAYCGVEIGGDLKRLLGLSVNISNKLNEVFPRTTVDEMILFHVINLDFIDEGFCPGPEVIRALRKRVEKLIAVSQRLGQSKIARLLLR